MKSLSLPLVLSASLAALPCVSAQTPGSAGFEALRQKLAQAPGGDSAMTLNQLFDGAAPSAQGAFTAQDARTLPSGQGRTQAQVQRAMLQNLDFIQSAFAAQYGPGQWKEAHEGWDLDAQIAAAKKKVESTPGITVNQYHDILRGFFGSMKDYHVSVGFSATAASSLPFSVIGSNGRYFIEYIDRNKLPESSFPFKPGDEITALGGRPVADVVKGIQAKLGGNTNLTDRALASLMLTSRRAASGTGGGDVQQGPVSVSVIPQGSTKPQTRALIWEYTPEVVTQPAPAKFFADSADFDGVTAPKGKSPALAWLDGMTMLAPQAADAAPTAGNPFGLGGRSSYLPALGEKTWQADDGAIFDAYIYKNAEGRPIGYVRIPSYETDNPAAAVKEFGELMARFQQNTDGLVIDQVNNPGGSVFYLYALASMLTDQPLATPQHKVAITQEDVAGAAQLLKLEPVVKNDALAKMALGSDNEDGYPVDYMFFQHLVTYSRFIVDQWNQGKTLTDPTFLNGADQINPSLVSRYTKPVLLLINELDFSGGDFFPAIMQDNKRATLFGTRTAGAGGFVRQVKFPNAVGVDHFSMTGSIAVRASGKPIENLGVTADVQYAPTPADLQNGFKDYAKAANAAMKKLLDGGATASR